ncbi:hypothetical protein I7I48_08666 [Histoplasma ohiense]|nr:hypothetical protein I7I48_08666 [Histoplasma ohiense (nom. inval.)]
MSVTLSTPNKPGLKTEPGVDVARANQSFHSIRPVLVPTLCSVFRSAGSRGKLDVGVQPCLALGCWQWRASSHPASTLIESGPQTQTCFFPVDGGSLHSVPTQRILALPLNSIQICPPSLV